MTTITNVPEDKKMIVTFRVEPGSLGPEGAEYVVEFCEFAQIQLQACATAHITWSIVPRYDKSLPEMGFQVSTKKLTRAQAMQYLNIFNEKLADFEDQLEDHLEAIINQYFGR